MVHRFREFEISDDFVDVRQDDAVNALTPQTSRLLRCLIEAEGRVMTKDALIEAVWGDRIVTDATLSTAVKEARHAIGDSGQSQKAIRTIHGTGFRFVAEPERHAVDDRLAGKADPRPTIAVLPIRALSSGADAALIADGLTEETIARLSSFRDLMVFSRVTTAHFADSGLDPLTLQSRHGVEYVLTGSLRLADDEIRVRLHVEDAGSGEVVATERFARPHSLSSIYEIQDDIAELAAGRIASRHAGLAQHFKGTRTQGRPNQMSSYLLVARFYDFYRSYDLALHAELRDQFPVALSEDPDASDCWAAYAMLLLEEYRYHLNERLEVDASALCLDAARRAVACDGRSAFAFTALALAQFYSGRIAQFRASAERALELNSGHADVLAEIGNCHAFLGEEDRAIELLERAMEVSPIHPGWYHYARCWRYARRGSFEAAIVELQKNPMPGFFWYHAHLAWFFAENGDLDLARAEADIMLQLFPDFEARAYDECRLSQVQDELAKATMAAWRKAGLRIPDKEMATAR